MPKAADYSWITPGYKPPSITTEQRQNVLDMTESTESVCAHLERTDQLHMLLDLKVWDHLSGGTGTRNESRHPVLWPGSYTDYQTFKNLRKGAVTNSRNPFNGSN